jgi:hypothetical protein
MQAFRFRSFSAYDSRAATPARVSFPWWYFTGMEREVGYLISEGHDVATIAARLRTSAALVEALVFDMQRRLIHAERYTA